MVKNSVTTDKGINDLFLKVVELVMQARKRVATSVNLAEVYTKFHIGQYIVDYEQKGAIRAEYGKAVLKELSKRLTEKLGNGWSYPYLRQIRQFYMVYANLTNGVHQIRDNKPDKLSRISDSDKNDNHCLSNSAPTFTLSWSHYLILMRIENPEARSFYEIECTEQQWSVRQLSRQVGSFTAS